MYYYLITSFDRYANDSTFQAEHYLMIPYKLDSQENISRMKKIIRKDNPGITDIVILNFILLREFQDIIK